MYRVWISGDDNFASHVTTQCQQFYSWFPDPLATGVDAFTFNWSDFFYAFPPFNLISRVLRKIVEDNASGVVVVPIWPAQPWYPLFMELCKN